MDDVVSTVFHSNNSTTVDQADSSHALDKPTTHGMKYCSRAFSRFSLFIILAELDEALREAAPIHPTALALQHRLRRRTFTSSAAQTPENQSFMKLSGKFEKH
uniref:Uncharacterized protein n=1 Tax=Romanomermis culicivorax TaxID=13658 RepID=A0A915KPQ9_ROMCU